MRSKWWEEARHLKILGGNVLGRKNSMCKDPGVGSGWCWDTKRRSMYLNRRESGGRRTLMKKRDAGLDYAGCAKRSGLYFKYDKESLWRALRSYSGLGVIAVAFYIYFFFNSSFSFLSSLLSTGESSPPIPFHLWSGHYLESRSWVFWVYGDTCRLHLTDEETEVQAAAQTCSQPAEPVGLRAGARQLSNTQDLGAAPQSADSFGKTAWQKQPLTFKLRLQLQ